MDYWNRLTSRRWIDHLVDWTARPIRHLKRVKAAVVARQTRRLKRVKAAVAVLRIDRLMMKAAVVVQVVN